MIQLNAARLRTRSSALGVLVALACLQTGTLAAQQSGSPGTGPGPALKEITQERTYPDGTRHVIHLQAKIEFKKELQAYLVTIQATKEDPALAVLNEKKTTPTNLPARIIKSMDQFTPIDLHTDVRITQVYGTQLEGQPLEYYGKLTMCIKPDFNAPGGQQEMFSLAGTPGTRLDLSALFARKQRLAYLGRYWEATSDKDAILVVTKDRP